MPYPTTITEVGSVPQEQQYWGPYSYNGVRYFFGYRFTDGFLTVIKSTDQGATWAEVNAAFGKQTNISRIATFATCPNNDFATTPEAYVVYLSAANALRLAVFNFASETYTSDTALATAVYPSGSPSFNIDENSMVCVHRPSNNTVVVFAAMTREVVGPQQRFRCTWVPFDLNTLTWGSLTVVGTAGGDDTNYYSNAIALGDSDVIHFFYRVSPIPTGSSSITLMHVSLNAANTLGTPQTLYTAGVGATGQIRRSFHAVSFSYNGGVQVVVGNRITISSGGITTKSFTVWAAASAESPTWTETEVATSQSAQFTGEGNQISAVSMFYDGVILNAFYGVNTFDAGGNATAAVINQSVSVDGITWTAEPTFYTYPSAGFTVTGTFIGGGPLETAGDYGFAAEFGDGIADDVLLYWEGASEPPPPPAAVTLIPRYSGFSKPVIKCPNIWDWCLSNDKHLYRHLIAKGVCVPDCYKWVEPDVRMPKTGREFFKTGSIELPVAGSADQLVLSYRVPVGHWGIIYEIYQDCIDPLFVAGAAQLYFRWRINQVWVRNYANMDYPLGSLAGYYCPPQYVGLWSQNLIRAYVNIPTGSPLAGKRVNMGVKGWVYGRGPK